MRIFTALSFAFLLIGVACAKSPPINRQVEERDVATCKGGNDKVGAHIEALLARFRSTSSADEGEQLGVQLGQMSESYPCEFVTRTILAGLTDRQIASLITMMPIDFVDRPCESKAKLLARLSSLDEFKPSIERIVKIQALAQESVSRDSRECRNLLETAKPTST